MSRTMCDSTCIINADDFGRNSNVNAAILQSFQRGWISSSTIMPNMPGFEEACDIIHRHNLCSHVGIHFVLTKGIPLTDKIKQQHRFCNEDGIFCATRQERLFHLSTNEKDAVAKELRSQIEKCRRNGLTLTHIDSHHHIHEERGVLGVIIPLMREFGIPYIRIMCNTAELCSIHRRFYAMLYNSYLRYCGLSKTRYFGSIEQYIAFKGNFYHKNILKDSFEIMVHPTANDEDIIIDALANRPMEQLIMESGVGYRGESFSGKVLCRI